MKLKKLKVNIIPLQTPSTPEEDKKRLVEFFDLLYSWHLEEQRAKDEKEV